MKGGGALGGVVTYYRRLVVVPENVDEVCDGEHAWVMEENMHSTNTQPSAHPLYLPLSLPPWPPRLLV